MRGVKLNGKTEGRTEIASQSKKEEGKVDDKLAIKLPSNALRAF